MKFNSKLIPALALAFFALSAFNNNGKPADFSGTWLLNHEKSHSTEQGGVPAVNLQIRIIQQDPALIMERSVTDSTGKVYTDMDTLAFDGKEKLLKAGEGQALRRVMKRSWSVDEQIMTLNSTFTVEHNGSPVEFNGTETWKLSADGKVLTIVNETVLPDRTDLITLVYTKQ